MFHFGYLRKDILPKLSKLVVDILLPALIFTRLTTTTSWENIVSNYRLCLIAVAMISLSLAFSYVTAKIWRIKINAIPIVFLSSMSNWIYLPLPILTSIYGEQGTQIVLLFNLGALVTIWSLGIVLLQGSVSAKTICITLVKTPGIWATCLSVFFIWIYRNQQVDFSHAFLYEILEYLGAITIPMTLLVTGANLLANLDIKTALSSLISKQNLFIQSQKLIVLPWITYAVLKIFENFGYSLEPAQSYSLVLIASMPIAINAGLLVDRYTNESKMAYENVLFSTILVLITLPLNIFFFTF